MITKLESLYLTLGRTSKVTPPPWYKGGGLASTPLLVRARVKG